MPDTKELEDEVARLRARVQELERERDLDDDDRDRDGSSRSHHRRITSRAADDGGGLFRAVALAGVEVVRATGSVLSSFADTVSSHNRPAEKDSRSDLTRDLPKDMYTGVLNAAERVLDIPDRVIDRLHEGYKESRNARDSRDTREARDTRDSSAAATVSKDTTVTLTKDTTVSKSPRAS